MPIDIWFKSALSLYAGSRLKCQFMTGWGFERIDFGGMGDLRAPIPPRWPQGKFENFEKKIEEGTQQLFEFEATPLVH